MDVLVCVKRVPMVGGRIALQPDQRHIDTTLLGFTVSPHEECAVEEAVQVTEAHGGEVTVLTLGPPEAAEQLRAAVSVGAASAVLLPTEEEGLGPIATARAITSAVTRLERERSRVFDLVMFGNEAADTGDYQVGIRVAHALGRAVATGVKQLEVTAGEAVARREYRGAEELFRLPLPAVVTVKEGINLPRYPSLPGRMRAKKATIVTFVPETPDEAVEMRTLRVPTSERRSAEVLGHGKEAVPALVSLLEKMGVVS